VESDAAAVTTFSAEPVAMFYTPLCGATACWIACLPPGCNAGVYLFIQRLRLENTIKDGVGCVPEALFCRQAGRQHHWGEIVATPVKQCRMQGGIIYVTASSWLD
jgi:hypothetical protein